MQSAKVYVEDHLQQDWSERLGFAINNSRDMTRKETPFICEVLINRQQQIALEVSKEYQAVEKARCARINNEKPSRKEQAAIPKRVNDDSSDDDSEPKSLFLPGSPFAYDLELPDKNGYRFYPVVDASRLKVVNEFCDRPNARLARGVDEEARFDFDEELLPEDRWEPDEVASEFEMEAILSDRTLLSRTDPCAILR
ncbi:hypothetical protein PHMEG_00035720 [Phytophthora megakarya]|uniref:Uncharacterized protein n=1 Tax=Phytophthora megakarya TaxID=4795 RepID=A0A225UNH7_9STRA|nr:hypothetical protein PHMEG_00035720 [Phytophthora megakarya]